MVEDVVRSVGHLALGSRLKRIGERLQAQTQVVLAQADADVAAAQCTALEALDRLGPISVGDLAQALGVSQPGVTRMAGKLEQAGLVTLDRATSDRRINMVGLTGEGRRLVRRLQSTVWPRIEAAVAEACAGLSGPLLDQLAGLEDALAAVPLDARAKRP